MIKLTLCEEAADKDGGGKRVKGLNCLPYDKKEVPRSNLTSQTQLWRIGSFHCVMLYYKDTWQICLIISEDHSEVRAMSRVGMASCYNGNTVASEASMGL